MNKLIKVIFTVLIALTCFTFPTKLHAEDIVKKTVAIYNNIDSKKTNLDTYIFEDNVYVSVNDLSKMMGYIVTIDKDKILLRKKLKQVLLNNDSITYGTAKEDIKQINYDGKTLIPLTPTVNYLDGRIEMIDHKLILFKPEISFSEMVNEMDDIIKQGYLLVGKDENWSVYTSKLWMLINGESSSYIDNSRQERLVIELLTEDDADDFKYKESKALSIAKEASSFLDDIEFDIDEYDISFLSIFEKINITNGSFDTLVETEAIKNQIKHFYSKNIDNAEISLLHQHLYQKNDGFYKYLKKYIDIYNNNTKSLDEKWSTFINSNDIIDASLDILVGKAFPFLGATLSAVKIYSSIFDLNDQAAAILTKQDYNSIQCKVLNRIAEFHDSIKQGHVLSCDEIIDYMNLARMYYHIAAVYYKSMSELDKSVFEGNYKVAKSIVDSIDLAPEKVYTFDDPMTNPSNISREDIESASQTEDWSMALKEFINTYDFKEQWDIFNIYQSKLILTDINYDNIPELILCTEDGRGVDMRNSWVFSYENQSYIKKFNFYGKLLGGYRKENDEFYQLEEIMSGTFDGFTIISNLNDVQRYRLDKTDNSASLNNNKIDLETYETDFNKYNLQIQKVDISKSFTPFYKSLSSKHKEMICEQLINQYNKKSEKRELDAIYSDYDTRIYLIAKCDMIGLYTDASIEEFKLIDSKDNADIYEIRENKYELVKNDYGIEKIIDLKTEKELD